jgi:hypothetical protein
MTHTHTHAKAPTPCTATGAFDDSSNDLNFPTSERQHKAFSTLAAGFALKGYSLQRTDADDGPVTYFTTRWGLVQCLHSLDDAQRYLAQIGGVP